MRRPQVRMVGDTIMIDNGTPESLLQWMIEENEIDGALKKILREMPVQHAFDELVLEQRMLVPIGTGSGVGRYEKNPDDKFSRDAQMRDEHNMDLMFADPDLERSKDGKPRSGSDIPLDPSLYYLEETFGQTPVVRKRISRASLRDNKEMPGINVGRPDPDALNDYADKILADTYGLDWEDDYPTLDEQAEEGKDDVREY